MKKTKIYINVFLTGFFILLAVSNLFARPQYSMLSGNRCLNCHINSQGAALRSSLGSYSRKDIGFFDMEDTWLGNFFENISDYHSFGEELITIGSDYRFQTVKVGGPESQTREIFAMQLTPYLAIKPFDWLNFSFQYNFAKQIYPAQSRWMAYAIIQPTIKLPYVKIGMLKPSLGNFYDDHTTLVRQVAGPTRAFPIVPPDYAEYGAELAYDGLKYLSITAGVFDSKKMTENTIEDNFGNKISIADKSSVSKLFRVAFLPRFFENEINTNIGGSYFINGDFSITNLFVHLGWTDKISLMTEYMISNKKDLRKTNNYMVEVLYNLIDALDLYARYEEGNSEFIYFVPPNDNYKSRQIVLGANIYPIPYIEIRPEYRIYDREFAESYSAQWTVQLHVYF